MAGPVAAVWGAAGLCLRQREHEIKQYMIGAREITITRDVLLQANAVALAANQLNHTNRRGRSSPASMTPARTENVLAQQTLKGVIPVPLAEAPVSVPKTTFTPRTAPLGGHTAAIPTHIRQDRTLRLKVIDTCGMTCTFCHNEGTPVVSDNSRRSPGEFISGGASGRVSIYLATNGANFLPAKVVPDQEFTDALAMLREALHLNELHLTGGEPTLHTELADIVRAGTEAGLRVCVTSNGERGAAVLEDCARAGLDRINFSVFGTTAEELAQVQEARFANVLRAQRKIDALRESIQLAESLRVRASANIVVPDYSHAPRVRRLLDEYSQWISVRLLNSLDDGPESIEAVERVLADLGAIPVANHVTAGVSGSRTEYKMPNGRTVWFKKIRSVRLPKTCAGCRFNNGKDCQEGFYGVRLYRDAAGGYQVGVCIQRMDLCMPVAEFVRHDLCREVIALRESEYRELSAQMKN